MKKFLFESFCCILITAITIVGVISISFANQTNSTSEKSTTNEELVPLAISYLSQTDSKNSDSINSNSVTSDLPLSNSRTLSVSNKSGVDLTNADLTNAGLTNADLSNADLINSDEIQFGNDLRKILSRPPEIATDKIPHIGQPPQSVQPVIIKTTNYRNNNPDDQKVYNQTLILAQSTTDQLATRPDPPSGQSPDLSVIPSALINDSKAPSINSVPNVNQSSLSNHNRQSEVSNESKNNVTKNLPPLNSQIINRNDLASVVNGWLLVATIISIAALVYVVIIAADYHQRWMQTLTAQNDRYISADDYTNNGLNDIYESAERNRTGTDFFSYPAT
ncbi:MAG: pentapeptide repeat-containing protein [Planctomycetaceae bacterium]|jgi:hypothetical protein|nr:pentapeptide repeat-containing protein [Planctomycetaceae bacterium]